MIPRRGGLLPGQAGEQRGPGLGRWVVTTCSPSRRDWAWREGALGALCWPGVSRRKEVATVAETSSSSSGTRDLAECATCVCKYVSVSVSMGACARRACVCVCLRVHICVCVSTYRCACWYVCTSVLVFVWMCVSEPVPACVCTCLCERACPPGPWCVEGEWSLALACSGCRVCVCSAESTLVRWSLEWTAHVGISGRPGGAE